VLSGAKSSALNEGGTYDARNVLFNAVGPGVTTTFPSAIGPFADAPVVISAYPFSWNTPSFDGGSAIEEFLDMTWTPVLDHRSGFLMFT
jgi:hypothetical protein